MAAIVYKSLFAALQHKRCALVDRDSMGISALRALWPSDQCMRLLVKREDIKSDNQPFEDLMLSAHDPLGRFGCSNTQGSRDS
jgi:hypothetical protein